MQSSYSRWWEGRIQWDKLSADSRSFARTVWLHVPLPTPTENPYDIPDKVEVIRCVHTLAVALKHHLRGERDWSECSDLEQLLAHLPNVSHPSWRLQTSLIFFSKVQLFGNESSTDLDTTPFLCHRTLPSPLA